ncbi:MAG: serine hydroxymethyltransferase, partial [Thermoplasmata archaeon]|nr:serine hydroxymethyltransferase [Thermoplasmata archaeon]
VNKNMVPFDTKSPFITSGIRIGTPALTTKGMKEDEMKTIGNLIHQVLSNLDNESVISKTRKEVFELNRRFPLYR